MTEQEKAAAEAEAAKVAAETKAKEDEAAAAAAAVEDAKIAERDAIITKLEEERDNYKAVALKRLGKLPEDSEFVGANGEDIQSYISDQVKKALIEREIDSEKNKKELEYRQALKENSELKLALKNRPGGSIGGDAGSTTEVKDNVFSPEQIVVLKQKALRLKLDPDKFVENAKKNLLARN